MEVRVERPVGRGVRPVDQAGVAVDGQQLPIASQAVDPVADDPAPCSRPAGLVGVVAPGPGERVRPATAGVRVAGVEAPEPRPMVQVQGDQPVRRGGDHAVRQIADPAPARRRGRPTRQAATVRVDRAHRGRVDQEDRARARRRRQAPRLESGGTDADQCEDQARASGSGRTRLADQADHAVKGRSSSGDRPPRTATDSPSSPTTNVAEAGLGLQRRFHWPGHDQTLCLVGPGQTEQGPALEGGRRRSGQQPLVGAGRLGRAPPPVPSGRPGPGRASGATCGDRVAQADLGQQARVMLARPRSSRPRAFASYSLVEVAAAVLEERRQPVGDQPVGPNGRDGRRRRCSARGNAVSVSNSWSGRRRVRVRRRARGTRPVAAGRRAHRDRPGAPSAAACEPIGGRSPAAFGGRPPRPAASAV